MRVGWIVACAAAVRLGCHREPSAPPPDPRTACERALGTWQGDDVESAGSQPAEREMARTLIRAQQWRVTETQFETIEGGHTTREGLRIVQDGPARCTVDVSLGDVHRQLDLDVLTDGRLRIGAPGGHVAMLVRRVP